RSQGTTTNSEGYFELKNLDENATLVISGVSIETREVKVDGKNDLSELMVRMKVTDMEDVTVTINTGYQQIKPEQSTGSIFTLSKKEYESRINTTDFLTGLQNKIPGLLINNDIKFEGNGLFQIRGISTINGNRKPLIVVD